MSVHKTEVDYMTDADFEAIYSIVLEAPDRIEVMMASTPTGRRGSFYKACVELPFNQEDKLKSKNTKMGYVYDTRGYDRGTSEGWKEFHFSSMCNPEWSSRMENELKKQYSEVAYEHEILAEFGTETVGVFNKDFIEEAASVFYQMQEVRRTDGPIAIGVDWDRRTCPLWVRTHRIKLGELMGTANVKTSAIMSQAI